MGQAKKRGTFEERRQQAVDAERVRQEAAWEAKRARLQEEQDRVDAMTDAERDAYFTKRNRRRSPSMAPFLLTSMAAAAMGGYGEVAGGVGRRRARF